MGFETSSLQQQRETRLKIDERQHRLRLIADEMAEIAQAGDDIKGDGGRFDELSIEASELQSEIKRLDSTLPSGRLTTPPPVRPRPAVH